MPRCFLQPHGDFRRHGGLRGVEPQQFVRIGKLFCRLRLRVLETKELGQRIQQTLDALSDEYRLLLLLVADEELSYEEIAALVGQSADAVRGKLHRARKAFAVLFEKTA